MGIDTIIYLQAHPELECGDDEEGTMSIEELDGRKSLPGQPEKATHAIYAGRYYDEMHRGYSDSWPWMARTLLCLWNNADIKKIWYQPEDAEQPKPLTKQRFLKIMQRYIEEAR